MKRKLTNKLFDCTFNLMLYAFNFRINTVYSECHRLYHCSSYFNAGTYFKPIWIKAFTDNNYTLLSSAFGSIKKARTEIKYYNQFQGENKKRMFASMMGTEEFNKLIMKLALEGKELKIK